VAQAPVNLVRRSPLDEAPILPVYFYTHTFLIRAEVKGWYPTILDHHPYEYVRLE
jgi:oligopeptide transport system substrate-binding protein